MRLLALGFIMLVAVGGAAQSRAQMPIPTIIPEAELPPITPGPTPPLNIKPPSGGSSSGSPSSSMSSTDLLQELSTVEDIQSSSLLKTRDPFNPPEVIAESQTPKSDLESSAIESIKLSGVIVGMKGRRDKAILVTPNGKTHIIGEGTRIGMRQGTVKKITSTGIIIQERFPNVFGKMENINTEIRLLTDKGEKR